MKKSYIICIDDETIVLDSLQSELRIGFEDDYLIEVSENAQDALALVEELLEQSCDIPIVICDYIMPEMKGDELLSLIHQLSPDTRTILLTGQSNIEGITNAINHANLYRFISKPWNSQDLNLTIREGIKSYYQKKDIAAQNQQLKEMNTVLEKKVKQRTAALENTLTVLHQKNQMLEVKNHEIESSIRYAQRIQKATLPSQLSLSEYLDDHFLIFQPRDVVSGDFYWFYQLEHQPFPRLGKVPIRREARAPVILVLADCTGHGVPGAFMSMIGNNLLNQIVIQQGVQEPTQILSLLNEGIYQALQQEENQNTDGMDISICRIDYEQKILDYAGGIHRLVFFQDGEIGELKGNRYPVGGYHYPSCRRFDNFQLSLKKPLTFYIFSDGYQDQLGGERGRKFGIMQLRQLLTSLQGYPMKQQAQVIKDNLKNWMGATRQLDDISLIGGTLDLENS